MKLQSLFLILIVTVLGGCVAIPVDFSEPYSDESIGQVELNKSTRDDIISTFGEPHIVRKNNSIWFYLGCQRISVFGYGGGEARHCNYQWMLMSFMGDVVNDFQLIERASECSTIGICIIGMKEVYEYAQEEHESLQEMFIPLAPPLDDESAKKFMYPVNGCRVYGYLKRQGWFNILMNGWHIYYVSVDSGPVFFSVNDESYFYIDHEANPIRLDIVNYSWWSQNEIPTQIRSKKSKDVMTVECLPGQLVIFELDNSESGVTLTQVNIDEGKSEILKRRLLLPP